MNVNQDFTGIFGTMNTYIIPIKTNKFIKIFFPVEENEVD